MAEKKSTLYSQLKQIETLTEIPMMLVAGAVYP